MSNLVKHFRRELERFETDEKYIDGMCKVAEAFSEMGHSGGSASVAVPQLNKLLQFKNLTPLTDDPAEWIDHTGISSRPLFQNIRNSEAFSEDGGKRYYLLSENKGKNDGDEVVWHDSEPAVVKSNG